MTVEKAEKLDKVRLPRFGADEFMAFLHKLSNTARSSKSLTPTEEKISRIEEKLERDFPSDYKPSSDGTDPYSITKLKIEELQPVQWAEIVEAEKLYLQEQMLNVKEYLTTLECRHAELDNSVGGSVFQELEGAKAKAKANIQRKQLQKQQAHLKLVAGGQT